MSRFPRPHAGIMAVLMPFVILLLILIALEPAPAAGAAARCQIPPAGVML